MSIINRMFTTNAELDPGGVLVIPYRVPYFAKLLHCTFRNLNPSFPHARKTHVHDLYHVILVTSGKGTFVIGKKHYAVEAGHLFLTSPGEWHSFGNAPGETAEYCEATFEFRDRARRLLTIPFHAMLSAWTGKRCQPVLRATLGADVHGLIMSEIERMVRLGFSEQADVELFLNESLSRILLLLYAHVFRERPPESTGDPLQAVQEFIHLHFAEHHSLAKLSKLIGFTPNYLSRRFKVRYGTTPITYQHRLRMQAAANLLLTTERPIKTIAGEVGFADIYFFSRMFKKYKGAPPGAFRKMAQNV